MLDFFLDLILPRRCVHCRRILPAGALCAGCRAAVMAHATLFCGRCRARLPLGPSLPDGRGLFRVRSPCHPHHPYVLGAAHDYQGPVKSLICALKFDLVRDAGAELGAMLKEYVEVLGGFPADVLAVPVPLSSRRLRERGFNQAEIIARAFTTDVSPSVLRRVRNTKPQSTLGAREERLRNVADCFEAGADVAGQNVILIDDVVTSGATLQAAALALKHGGAKAILALAGAKA